MNNRGYHWLLLVVYGSLFFPTMALALTAEEVITKAAENLQGPKGKTVLAEGKMRFAQRNLDVRIARYCQDGTEGFQIDILSQMEDQEVPGAGPQTNKKYRVVRNGVDISTLTYLPSLRRGRKINYVPLDGVLGSEYPYYLLPLASDLLHDFSYSYIKEDQSVPIIKGVSTTTSRSPYTQVTVELQKRGETYTLEKAVYELSGGSRLVFSLQDFVEFTPGYWAPGKVIANGTNFVFDGWTTRDPLRWLHSINHNMFDAQSIPLAKEQ